MTPSFVAMLAAALVAATPTSRDEGSARARPLEVALGVVPPEGLDATLLLALPPPPTVVVRDTQYYGKITIEHAKHLARRASCKTCHGPGIVSKISFTPKVAHSRCVGCHQEQAKGPTRCQDCHVREAPPPAALVAAAAPAADAAAPPKPPKPPGPNPDNVSAALAAFDNPRGGSGGGAPGREPFHRTLEMGLAAGSGAGLSVRLASHQNLAVVAVSVERMSADAEARTYGLVGAGLTRPLGVHLSIEALVLAGFDAFDRPTVTMLPALGARAGVEWRLAAGFLKAVSVSVTGVTDLSTRQTSAGALGGVTVYATVATGFWLSRR